MAIPQSFIQELLARADVVEIVGRYVQLKKGGANFMGLCPFHGEKSPSFTVSPSKQFYHCFGCGKNGNAIGFLMEHAGMNFVEAVKDLAGQYGMQVPEDDASPAGPRPRRAAAREAGHADRRAREGRRGLPQAPEEFAAAPSTTSRAAASRARSPSSSAWATRPRAGAAWPACFPTTTIRCWPKAAWSSSSRGGRGQALRPLPRPRDVPDPQRQGRMHRLRRPRAGRRKTQVPELAGNAGVQQGPRALWPVRGAQRPCASTAMCS